MVRCGRLYWLPLLGLVGCLGGGTSGGRIRGIGTSGPGPGFQGAGGSALPAFQQPPLLPSRWQQHRRGGGRNGAGGGGNGGGSGGAHTRPLAATTMSAPSLQAQSPQPPQQPQQQPQAQGPAASASAPLPRRQVGGGSRRWREGEGDEGGNGGSRRWHPVGGDLADVTLLRSVEAGIRERCVQSLLVVD